MKKTIAFLLCLFAISACSKHDPILPGVRSDIFDSNEVIVQNKDVPELSESVANISGDADCEYRQDAMNVIWFEDKKITQNLSF